MLLNLTYSRTWRALFHSKRFQNNETELVVFATSVAVDKNSLAFEESMAKAALRLNAPPYTAEPDMESVPGLVKPIPAPNWDESSQLRI